MSYLKNLNINAKFTFKIFSKKTLNFLILLFIPIFDMLTFDYNFPGVFAFIVY